MRILISIIIFLTAIPNIGRASKDKCSEDYFDRYGMEKFIDICDKAKEPNSKERNRIDKQIAKLHTKQYKLEKKNEVYDGMIYLKQRLDKPVVVDRDTDEITTIVVHHTATRSDLTADEMELSMKRTYVDNRGFNKIPTHYIIDTGGGYVKVNEPTTIVGAIHSRGDQDGNHNGVHIEMVGNFHEHKPTKEQYKALNELIKMIQDKYPMVTEVTSHGYYQQKQCPGKHFNFCKVDLYNGEECNTPISSDTNANSPSFIGKGKVTTYHSFPGGSCPQGNINCSGDSLQPARGKVRYGPGVEEQYVACSKDWKLGTQFKLVHPQLGDKIVTCADRGSAIVGKTRFDLWVGIAGSLSRKITTFYDVEVYHVL